MRCDLEELRAHLVMVAELAVRDPIYLPIFERIEQMIAEAESKGNTLARVRAIAAQGAAAQSAMA